MKINIINPPNHYLCYLLFTHPLFNIGKNHGSVTSSGGRVPALPGGTAGRGGWPSPAVGEDGRRTAINTLYRAGRAARRAEPVMAGRLGEDNILKAQMSHFRKDQYIWGFGDKTPLPFDIVTLCVVSQPITCI